MLGYYYLHENGSLIFKNASYPIEDMRDSDLVKSIWNIDTSDRESAWNLLVEAGSIGADKERINELADKWGCDNLDAKIYASRVGVALLKEDERKYVASSQTKIGEGDSYLWAMIDLCKQLKYTGGKLNWHATFKGLLKNDRLSSNAQ